MHKTNYACCWCTHLHLRLTKITDMRLCPNAECEIGKKKENGVANGRLSISDRENIKS